MAGVEMYSTFAAQNPGAIDIDYMLNVGERTLTATFELIQHGSKAIKPSHTGDQIYVPKYPSAPAAADKLTAVRTRADLKNIVPTKRTGTIHPFAEYYGLERTVARFSALFDHWEEMVRMASYAVARAMEDEVLLQVVDNFAEVATLNVWTEWVAPHNLLASTRSSYVATEITDYGLVTDGDHLIPEAIFGARRLLRRNFVPGFNKFGRRYIWMASPDAIFQVQTNISASNLTLERQSMQMESVFVDNVIGVLGGFAVIEADYSAKEFTATSALEHGMVETKIATCNLLFGAQAFYVSPLDELNLEIIEHWFGEGGAEDPANQLASVCAVGYLGAIAGGVQDSEVNKKLVRMPVPVI